MKISKINSNFNLNKNYIHRNNNQNINNQFFNKRTKMSDTISFKRFHYAEDKNDIAKRYLYGQISREEIIEQEQKEDFDDFLTEMGETDVNFPINFKNPLIRAGMAVWSLGFTEGIIQTGKLGVKRDAKHFADDIELVKENLIEARQKEEVAEALKKKALGHIEINFIKEMEKVKSEQLYPALLLKIQAKREGKNVEIPNCIMLSHNDDSVNKELLNWCLANANAKTATINPFTDDIIDKLEEAEQEYQKTGDWNVIYVEDMDILLNREEVDASVVESMKDIMCTVAEDFHSTLIFTTTNENNLDAIALETNRVKRIDTSNITTIEEGKRQYIELKLQDTDYVKNSPIALINDLIEYFGVEPKFLLSFESSQKDLQTTCEKINEILTDEQKELFEELIKQAKQNAWYCTKTEIVKKTATIVDAVPNQTNTNQTKTKGLVNVIGMDELKETLTDEIINPMKNPEIYKEYGIEGIINGFMLYGPPGCGKTYIMKNLADELDRYFVEIKPSDVGSIYQHETAKKIAEKFNEAKRHAPSIVFIDEIEAIAPTRDGMNSNSSDISEQVTELLQQMNNAKDSNILIVCATNEPQKIDKAIKRTGRLDKKIFVPNPDKKTRKALIETHIKNINKKDTIDCEVIAQETEYYTAKDIEMLIRTASIKAMKANQNVTTELILDSIKDSPPSLSEELVALYKLKGEL